ncbi:MAG TPA: hypothetical protein PKE32_03935 [Miltoncostaeaceae bacterium]|nr:hypothetical protein [Miltoncostaeaceae bacterium]
MKRSRTTTATLAAAAVACALAAAPALSAGSDQAPAEPPPPPPPPTATSGAPVQVVARGIPTPTSIAVRGSTVFVGSAGNEQDHTPGGVFAVRNGEATLVPGSEGFVMGVAWHRGLLYVSGGPTITTFSGWNGSTFTGRKVVYTAPKKFTGFNGLTFGPDGRLYAGVTLPPANDHTKPKAPFAQSVISMTDRGRDVRTVATGLRQPYQLAFVRGQKGPYVTVLGQDQPKNTKAPDYIVHLTQGDNYGFPRCNGLVASACKSFAKPFALLPTHSSPMGISPIGTTLYVSLFGGIAKSGPEVVAVSTTAKKPSFTPVLRGFVAPIVGLTTHGRTLYVGDLTGSVYSVRR